MNRMEVLVAACALWLWSANSAAHSDLLAFPQPLLRLLQPSTVVVLGEKHRQPESPQFVTRLAEAYLHQGGCLAVALEITSDQQPTLERVLAGELPVGSIQVFQGIDHPPYRIMIERLANLMQAGHCLTVHAIDEPTNEKGSRDAWMARAVEGLLTEQRAVLALIGNLHAVKTVHWEPTVLKPKRFLAEHLVDAGLVVVSVMQSWPEAASSTPLRATLVPAGAPAGITAVSRITGILAAYPPKTPEDVTDWVITWTTEAGFR
ncbi:TraB/GumN family protein [Thiohalomonas denitrificans]|uniref:Haem-binding uptake, Tiki superfamily, ChaN n=1 Tax=Thiohalomonas denitrificans TaxID=415747 RepID=A0A1G5QUG8_9GAMM|nr:hypothetical protein [Thiohalomonas denitrificans]SCZ64719.1 hypothetical protein SAMN03097708_02701 [Thiohalomonas denitrificans]